MIDNELLIFLAVINLVAFFLYGYDKWCSTHDRWRVSERNLLFIAAVGGSVGAYLGMKVFRHKTRHPKFVFLVPLMFFAQCVIVFLYKRYI